MPAGASRDPIKILWALPFCGMFALIAFSASLKLNYPLRNDQALFLMYASEMARGSILYLDIWDIKQPMIFLFYYVAGRLFGYSDVGVHLAELIWNLGLCVLICTLCRRHFGSRWLAIVAAFCILIYYVYVSPSEQTQIESLVALPILWSALFAVHAADDTPATIPLAFLAGVGAGVASAFKIPFALICCGIHGYVLLRCWRAGTSATAVFGRLALPWGLGAGVVWLLLLGWFARVGVVDGFLRATFVYPLEGFVEFDRAPLSRLLLGLAQIVVMLAPWLCLLAGFLLPRRTEERVPLARLLLIWIGIAIPVILVQRFSWWPYQWFQLLVPLFLLCMLGLDRIVGVASQITFPGSGRRRMVLLSLLLLAPFTAVLVQLGQNAFIMAEAGAPGSFDGTAFRLAVDRNYDEVLASTAAFPGDCSRDRIYVFGTPAIYLRLNCRYLYTFAGQNLRYMRAAQRAKLAEKLQTTPPDWIFVAPGSADRLRRCEPELQALLDGAYRQAAAGDWGAWYQHIVRE